MAASTKHSGRKSVYRKENAHLAFAHTLIGATDKDLARLFEVDERTINRWKERFPEFCQSIKKGKDAADAQVAASLFKRANGFHVPAVKIFSADGQSFEHEFQEYHPPDVTAQIFWLKNRKPALFRTNPEVAVTVNSETTVDLSKPPEEWGRDEIEAELKRRGMELVPPPPATKPKGA